MTTPRESLSISTGICRIITTPSQPSSSAPSNRPSAKRLLPTRVETYVLFSANHWWLYLLFPLVSATADLRSQRSECIQQSFLFEDLLQRRHGRLFAAELRHLAVECHFRDKQSQADQQSRRDTFNCFPHLSDWRNGGVRSFLLRSFLIAR